MHGNVVAERGFECGSLLLPHNPDGRHRCRCWQRGCKTITDPPGAVSAVLFRTVCASCGSFVAAFSLIQSLGWFRRSNHSPAQRHRRPHRYRLSRKLLRNHRPASGRCPRNGEIQRSCRCAGRRVAGGTHRRGFDGNFEVLASRSLALDFGASLQAFAVV